MSPMAIPCLVLAGITCSVGAFYLLFHLKWRAAREYLPFALLCFAVAAYDVFSAGVYNASSLAEGIFWQRLQLVTLALASCLTIWFLELVTLKRLSRVGLGLIATLGALVVLTLTVHEPHVTLSVSTPSVKVVRWGGRELVTYYESQLGIVNLAGVLVVYFAYARLFRLLYRSYRESRSADLLGLMAGQLVYFASLLNDGLVGAGVYSFCYLSEYAYLAVISTMAYALLGRFVALHVKVGLLNESLERRVAEALAAVKVLRGLIPICAACKKIRDDQGFWTRIEEYLTEHSEATLSHGICPDCMRELYPEVMARRGQAARERKADP